MAGGTFSKGEIKTRPGHYHREESDNNSRSAEAINGVGAGLIKANWGPLNEAVEFEPEMSVGDIYGKGLTEDLVTEMFNGGIETGYFVRIGTGGTAPTVALKDKSDADVVQITGKYVGERQFTISIRESLIKEDEKECTIYDGASEFAKVTFAAGEKEPEALVEAINSQMSDFIAKKIADGDGKVAEAAQKKFTDGTNPAVTTAEYSAGLNVLEAYEWNCLCVDTEDATVHLLVSAFLNRIFAAGAFPMACVSEKAKGESGIPLETRMANAAAFNNKMMHYVLNPAYDSAGTLYDGYRNAARIGGYIASVATTTALTGTPIAGYTRLAEPLTNTQITNALKRGCIALTLNKKKQVVIEQGINTLVTPPSDEDDGWKKIRRVKVRYELIQRVMAALETLKVDNDDEGRAAVIAKAYGVYSDMVGEKKLLAGGSVYEDKQNPASGDSAWFIIECDDKDSLEKTYSTFKFRFTRVEA